MCEDFATRVQQALGNLQTAVRAADANLCNIAKVSALIVDHNEERLRLFSRALRATCGEHPAPACTLIPVPRLALDGVLFEIEATSVI